MRKINLLVLFALIATIGFAEGVQDWFNVNAEVAKPDGKHNEVNTRRELAKYDHRLYAILKEVFPETDEAVSCHRFIDNFKLVYK